MNNLRNVVTSLLDIFNLNKGRKIDGQTVALAPLIQRLSLPPMPAFCQFTGRVDFMKNVIQEKFPGGKISRRVLGKICRHYGVDLRGFGLFQAIPGKRHLLVLR